MIRIDDLIAWMQQPASNGSGSSIHQRFRILIILRDLLYNTGALQSWFQIPECILHLNFLSEHSISRKKTVAEQTKRAIKLTSPHLRKHVIDKLLQTLIKITTSSTTQSKNAFTNTTIKTKQKQNYTSKYIKNEVTALTTYWRNKL